MSARQMKSKKILNNLNDHVDSGDVLFVLTDGAAMENQMTDVFNKKCRSKCPGRRKLNRKLHSKVIDASQFVAMCDEQQCPETKQQKALNDMTTGKHPKAKPSEKSLDQTSKKSPSKKDKRKIIPSNTSRIKPPVESSNRKKILRQMKNHTISSTYDSKKEPGMQTKTIRPSDKLKELEYVFDNVVRGQKWDGEISPSGGKISAIMNRIGFSKYGFKILDKSPYATRFEQISKMKNRKTKSIVPRHHCFTCRDTRVPSYMGWYWTRIFCDKVCKGWRPGAIPKNIRDIMCYFNGPCSCMPNDVKTCQAYIEKLQEATSDDTNMDKVVARKPTLKVVRKDGLYFVSMNPLKPSKELNITENPYLDNCQPIEFQIALNRPESNEMGLLGYPCSERPALCEDSAEMRNLLKILDEECQNDSEFYELAKTLCSKESDLDIEFIAPGANLWEKSKNCGDEVYEETQYDRSDFEGILKKSARESGLVQENASKKKKKT